jgi:NADPH:quinone reductase-like Zn-dependent oxidoreductase
MKALVCPEKNADFQIQEIPLPECDKGMALVQLHAAALNHRDLWISKGQYARIQYPFIPGSDGCGTVIRCDDAPEWIGKKVIINPNINWGDDPRAQSALYQILGMPTQGTCAEYIAVPVDRLHAKPAHLDDIQAAALPLAGLTAWRAVYHSAHIKAGENVLITGIGGGVALMAFQFALALGANIWVSSGDDAKIQKAISMGAKGGANYHHANWTSELPGGNFDCIIDSAGGAQLNTLVQIAAAAARIVFYGATLGSVPELVLQRIFWKQLSLKGCTMGNDQEFAEMLDFTSQKNIIPLTDSIYPLEQGHQAFQLMEKGKQFGKIVLTIS